MTFIVISTPLLEMPPATRSQIRILEDHVHSLAIPCINIRTSLSLKIEVQLKSTLQY